MALAEDPTNVIAHAMLGHWLLWSGDSVAVARQHFSAALSTVRNRRFARALELSAFENKQSDLETIRVAYEAARLAS
jgi:hypothetical protein